MTPRLTSALAALALAGCASGVRRVGSVLPGDPSWPRDGGRRIAYVGELRTPENLGIEPGFFGRLWRAITGSGDSDALYRPYAVALGPSKVIAVADPGRRAVHLFDAKGERYARASGLGYPVAVAFVGSTLIVADAERRTLLAFDLQGRPAELPVRVPALERPAGLAFDAKGQRLFVSDSAAHVVHVLSLAGKSPATIGGRGSGDGELNFPTHLFTDVNGRLYVCDAMNFRVQIFAPDLSPLRRFGEVGDRPGNLSRPKGIAVDADGNVFVVEGYFDVVQAFDGEGRLLGIIGGSGIAPGRFWLPAGAAVDGRLLYVADTFNGRVQVFDLEQMPAGGR